MHYVVYCRYDQALTYKYTQSKWARPVMHSTIAGAEKKNNGILLRKRLT